uniref:F-box domain-containing protein n=1 Tax=Oryza nivara TaxID=4536 RepID=A0A0E0HA86_ORYNI
MAFQVWIPPAAEKLTDDLLVEVLSRVPYKSLCRSKRVCRQWRRVISDPDHRRLLPRYHLHDAVVGFFDHRSFISFSGRGRFVGPSLPFLPDCGDLRLLDICNGLLLCRRRRLSDPRRFDYLVANPATEQWIVLPESGWTHKEQIARLGFDPAVSSSHFHVFEFELVEHSAMGMSGDHDGNVVAVEIYSSETGVWIHRNNGWGCIIRTLDIWRSVFFKGMLHLITMDDVVAVVDVEGNSWRTIPMPETFVDPYYGVDDGFIDDYGSDQWTLKHTVSHLHLFGTDKQHFGYDYKVVSIHPKRNIIFLVSLNDGIFISYEMDSREVHYICELGDILTRHYLPYVPLYSESLSNGARSWNGQMDALEIYSSETGVWSHKDIGWGHQIGVLDDWSRSSTGCCI